MTVAAYIRVSSKGQDHAMQRAAVDKAAASRGVAVGEWFAEKRSATKSMDRPELDRLRAAMRAGSVKLVFAFRLDRLMRTGPGDAFRFAEECHAHGVELVTVADGVRVVPGQDDVATMVLLFAFSLVGKLEAAARADRIAAARELAEAKGEAWGRPARLGAAERQAVADRVRAGDTVRAIAAALKVPRSTVARIAAQVNASDAAEGHPVNGPGWGSLRRSSSRVRGRASRNPPLRDAPSEAAPATSEPPASQK